MGLRCVGCGLVAIVVEYGSGLCETVCMRETRETRETRDESSRESGRKVDMNKGTPAKCITCEVTKNAICGMGTPAACVDCHRRDRNAERRERNAMLRELCGTSARAAREDMGI
jgi:hypothetical protein